MTATKSPKKKTGWDAFAADWLGVKKGKGGSGKGKKGGGELEQLFVLGVVLLIIYLAVTAALRAAANWWNHSFWPWFEDWRPWLTAGGLVLSGLAVTAVALWARARWRDRPRRAVQKRVEKRQPDEIPTKPRVVAVDDTGRAAEVVVPLPDGKGPADRRAREVADHHGRAEWGAPADWEVRVNPRTARDEVVLRPPVAAPVISDPVERDLTSIAQEQLPQVQAVKVTDRDPGGLPTRVEVHHEVTAKLLASPAVAEAIERALAAQLGWDDPSVYYRMRWDRGRGVGVMEQCDDPLPDVVPFPFGRITDIIDRDSKRLYYGVTGDGDEMVYWDLDCAPHTLIAGKTGSGKTASLTVFVVMALLSGWRVVMLDPKKKAFRDLDGLPNFERYGDAKGLDSARQMATATDTMHDIMEGRYDLDKAALKKTQRILFVIDETYIGIEAMNDLWLEERPEGDRSTEHPAVGKLRRMSGLAREANIHMMLAIQRPDTSLMGNKGSGYMRSNLDNKITVGPMDSDGAPMMFGRGTRWARMAQTVPAIKGRAMTPVPGGAIGYRLAQVWWLDLDDDAVRERVEAEIVERYGRHERLVDAPASEPADDTDEPETDDDGTGPEAATEPDAPAQPAKRPAKKAAARRPAKKAAAQPASGEPEILGRDNVLAGAKDDDDVLVLKRGDWTVIVDKETGERRNVRIATVTEDEDEGTVTLAGFGWKRTYEATDPVLRLVVAE